MSHSRALFAVAAVSLAAAIGGCGDDDDETTTAGATTTDAETATVGEAVETVDVSESEYELDPADPTISKSGTVEFKATNDGEEVHALEVEGPSGEAETEEIDPGDTATLAVELEPGEYTWYCPIDGHRELGMEGTITVAGGTSGGGSTTGEDQSGETGEGEDEGVETGEDEGVETGEDEGVETGEDEAGGGSSGGGY